ncbi:MAG: hypothetical protein HYY15_01675 [Candidatus Omnitrophica bacterium]|nr:hypothetical protein [Candidatus Omnitrophota bacterium]
MLHVRGGVPQFTGDATRLTGETFHILRNAVRTFQHAPKLLQGDGGLISGAGVSREDPAQLMPHAAKLHKQERGHPEAEHQPEGQHAQAYVAPVSHGTRDGEERVAGGAPETPAAGWVGGAAKENGTSATRRSAESVV